MTSSKVGTNDFYAGLSEDVRRELAGHGRVVRVPAGTALVEAGTSPKELLVLNSGSAETFVMVAGKPRSLGIAQAGKVFGLHFMLAEAPPNVNVTCLEECEVTFLPKDAFLELLERNPPMCFAFIQVLSSDLAAADRVIRKFGRGSSAATRL
jgi:CRP-like cAMP-binding protein